MSDSESENDKNEKYKLQIPWIEKYKPQNIDELYFPETIKKKILNITNTNNLCNLIITGPSGIGKTCITEIIANELYGKYYNDAVMELNLLDDKGVKFMQEDIISFCKIRIPYRNDDEKKYPKYKLIIFNEADNIIDRIQDQISFIMEKYKDNIRFIFTCNSMSVGSEINESIQTKCLILLLTCHTSDLIMNNLKRICNCENVKYENDAIEKIASFSDGDMRVSINKLQILFNSYGSITLKNLNNLCDIPHELIIKKIFDLLIKNNVREAMKIIFDLKKESYSGADIIMCMFNVLKSPICRDIDEKIKIKFGKAISDGIYNISNISDSNLQLAGCVIDMVS
ncbi:replication factor C small subunit [Bodo saltans virus]|uniref:Replication factor C small subunit n=1 Tax=Bodo saltans virus TaxID=2024608 RepID=A0A2H4UVR6_9VIRU|nr:replication factor C small subunit [Bodo saltans virus]ATZ80967.1 replication factor C small subunit [Bodo saltans virus]